MRTPSSRRFNHTRFGIFCKVFATATRLFTRKIPSDLGAWSQVAKHFNSRSPLACAVKWARVGSRNYTATLPDRGGSLADPMASAVHARCRSDAVAETASPTGVECVDDRWRAPRAEGHHDLDHDRRLSLIEKLQQHFHQPIIVAAEELGISLTVSARTSPLTGQ